MRAAQLGGLLAGCALLVGCGVSSQPSPQPVPPDRLPVASAEPTAGALQGRIWVARRDRVVPVFVDLPGRGLRARLSALLALSGPEQPLPTAIPAGTRLVRVVQQDGGLADVHVTGQLLGVSRTDLPLAVTQLVLTATEEPGIDAVQVTADGRPVVLRDGDDRPLRRALRRADVDRYVQGDLD